MLGLLKFMHKAGELLSPVKHQGNVILAGVIEKLTKDRPEFSSRSSRSRNACCASLPSFLPPLAAR